jgi:DNA-directed RNA polymerase specialized sigma24 family protein
MHLAVPNIYRVWLASARSFYDSQQVALAANPHGSAEELVEDDVIRQSITVAALRLVRSGDARRAMVLVGYGYTYSEIAERLGKTEKAVERMVAYAREQIRKGKRTA